MSKTKTNERFSFNYTATDDQTSDTLNEVESRFDNPRSTEDIVKRLNSWLVAIGYENIKVTLAK